MVVVVGGDGVVGRGDSIRSQFDRLASRGPPSQAEAGFRPTISPLVFCLFSRHQAQFFRFSRICRRKPPTLCGEVPLPWLREIGGTMFRTMPTRLLTPLLRRASTMKASRFIPSRLDNIEDVEDYQPGGYHPISIGDVFDQGRYRVLHKLGFGGSSTVWLVRDQREGKDHGRIATLKAIRADISSKSPSEIPELAIPQRLRQALPPSHSPDFQTVDHHFLVQGPSGSHHFLVFPLAGPSVLAMSDSPGRVSGSRRLRADLARKIAKQTATTLHHIHRAGVVHGGKLFPPLLSRNTSFQQTIPLDLTTSNILFRLSPRVIEWSDAELYTYLGHPERENVLTRDGKPPGPHAPTMLVEPVQNHQISHASFLQETTIISDFGQSYVVACPPPSYEPGTVLNYQSPEARFEGRAGFEADIWALGCAIFEIRAGFPLFEPFLGSHVDVLKQMVETLGRLPDPWWGAFEQRARWFGEDGQPKSEQDQERAGVLLTAHKTSIRTKLLEIGEQDDAPFQDEGPMIENTGTRLPEEEIDLLADLLQRMLRYSPEERIRIQDVILHPWFTL